jgi:NitT/TauT family transport system substrate-binding protein
MHPQRPMTEVDPDGQPAPLTRRGLVQVGGGLVLASAAWPLAACGGDSGGGGGGAGPYTGKQAIGHYRNVLAGGAPMSIAEAKGYFKEERLDLTTIDTPGGSGTVQVIMQTTHIGMPSTIGGVIAYSKGIRDLRLVSGIFNAASTYFIAPADSPITKDDLRGKKIGTSDPNSITTYFGRLLASKSGLTPGKDVDIIYVGEPPNAWTAVKKGVVDVAWSVPPFGTKLVDGKEAKVVVSARELNPDFADNTLWATKGFLEDNGDVVKRWLRAVGRAITLIRDDLEQSASLYAKALNLDPAVARSALHEYRDAFTLSISRKGVQANVDAARSMKQLGGDVPLDELIDDSYLPREFAS